MCSLLRQYRMEKQLHSLLWKIEYKEINYERQRHSQVSIESWVSVKRQTASLKLR